MRTTTIIFILLALTPAALAQPDWREKKRKQVNQIHYPSNDELSGVLQSADKARKAGKLAQAVELYRLALDSDGPKIGYQIASHPGTAPGQPNRLVGVTEWAIRGLRAMPPKGIKLFREKYDYRAASALKRGLANKEPYKALARAYELFPVASNSAEMLERMAELSLERGELARAKRVLQRLLTHHREEIASPPKVRKKMLLCAMGLGQADEVRKQALLLKRENPKGAIHLSGEPVKLEDLITRALRLESIRMGRAQGSRPSATLPRGDGGNRAAFRQKPAFGAARFRPLRFAAASRYRYRIGGRPPPGALNTLGIVPRHLAVVNEGWVFVATADSLLAFDLATGHRLRPIRRPTNRPMFSDPNPKVQFGAVVDRGVLIAPLVQEVLLDQSYRGIPIKVRIPIRKLAGFDLERWGWRWDHGRMLKDTSLKRWSFPCPPSTQEGVVYASAFSIEGFVNCYAAAFDSRTGKPLWSTWVASGQVEQTMFGEQATEPLCVPVAVSDGVVLHSTSFGCIAALEADNGRPLWVTEYDQIEVRAPRGYYADPRNITWENNAPIVESGVVVTTPLDSNAFYGFDIKTGRRLWKVMQRRWGAEATMKYLMGAAKGMVILAGGHDVQCVDIRTGKRKWRQPLRGRVVTGRGCILSDRVCVPLDDNTVKVFDLDTGTESGTYRLRSTGNLLVCGDNLVITGNGTLGVHVNGKGERDFK